MNEVLAFTIISALLVISPGPNGVLILKTVSTYGKKFAYINMFGLFISTFLHGALSIFGLSALVLQSAELFMMLKIIGASYLLYIGLKTIYDSYENKNKTTKNNLETKLLKNATFISSFSEGFLTQVLNPKVSMFYLAAFPQFINFKESAYLDAFILVSIHASINAIWFYLFANFLVKLQNSSKNSYINIVIQRVSGAIFVFFAGLLLTQESSK